MSAYLPYNERELLVRSAKGEDRAFEQLVVYYRPILLPYISTFTKNQERAEEVVQDVFLQVWLSRETLEKIRDFRSFLFVVSKNLALNAVRSTLREKLRLEKWKQANNENLVQQPEGSSNISSLLDQAIAQLPPQQKQAWIGARKEGRKLNEVAAEMNISKATVKKYVWYANSSIVLFLSKRTDFLVILALFCKNIF